MTFANAEATADRVNTWVAEKTKDRITDLVSPEALHPDMRLILANGVYFKARWADQFMEEVTRPKPFHLLPGAGTGSVEVPMMAKQGTFLYWKSESSDVAALRIGYEEGLSMLVVLPATGRFAELEAGLSADLLARIQAGSEWTLVDLELCCSWAASWTQGHRLSIRRQRPPRAVEQHHDKEEEIPSDDAVDRQSDGSGRDAGLHGGVELRSELLHPRGGAGPLDQPVQPLLRNSLSAHGRSHDSADDGPRRISVTAALDHRAHGRSKVTLIGEPGVEGHRNGVADEACDSFGEPQRYREIGGAQALLCRSDGGLDGTCQLAVSAMRVRERAIHMRLKTIRMRAEPIQESGSRHDFTLAGHLSRHVSRQRDGQRTGLGPGIRVGDPRGGANQTSQLGTIVDGGADDRCSHRRTVPGGMDPALLGTHPEPELEDGAQRGEPDSRWQPQHPETKSQGQLSSERIGVPTGADEGLSHHAGVLRVVRDHATPEKKTMPIGRTQEPLGPAARQTLVRQPDRVPDGRAEYGAEDVSFHHQEPCTSGISAGGIGRVSQPVRIGSVRILSPVSAKIAFVTAGTIGGVPGSPTPPGASPFGTSRTSTSGASSIRSIR